MVQTRSSSTPSKPDCNVPDPDIHEGEVTSSRRRRSCGKQGSSEEARTTTTRHHVSSKAAGSPDVVAKDGGDDGSGSGVKDGGGPAGDGRKQETDDKSRPQEPHAILDMEEALRSAVARAGEEMGKLLKDSNEGRSSTDNGRKKKRIGSPKRSSSHAGGRIIDGTSVAPNQRNRNSSRTVTSGRGGNPLTKLIPGYTAPMRLDSSGLDGYLPTKKGTSSSLTALRERAERSDASTADAVLTSSAQRARARGMTTATPIRDGAPSSSSWSYTKGGRPKSKDAVTAGAGWFHVRPSAMTDELKTDLSVLRMRGYLDPKRFYKSQDAASGKGVVQVGTVIEGTGEFFSSRLTRKQRRVNLTEEIMADEQIKSYTKSQSVKIRASKERRFAPGKKQRIEGQRKRFKKGY